MKREMMIGDRLADNERKKSASCSPQASIYTSGRAIWDNEVLEDLTHDSKKAESKLIGIRDGCEYIG